MIHNMTCPKLSSATMWIEFCEALDNRQLLHVPKVMIKAAKDVRAAKFMHERHPDVTGVGSRFGGGLMVAWIQHPKTLPKAKGIPSLKLT